jgi:hypothetical protein
MRDDVEGIIDSNPRLGDISAIRDVKELLISNDFVA